MRHSRTRFLPWVLGLVLLIGLLSVACQQAPAAAPAAPAKAGQAAAPTTAPAAPAAPAPSGAKKKLTLGTTNTASSHYAYLVAAAQAINKGLPEVNVTVAESGAAYDNINRMVQKEFDLGLVNDLSSYEAYSGMKPFDRKLEGIRILWGYAANPIIFTVRADSGVKTLQELDGKDFNPGTKGSGAEMIVENVMNSLGVKPKYYRGGLDDAVSAAKDRRIVGFAKGASSLDVLDASVQDLASQAEVRILKFSPEDEKKILAAFPYYAFVTVPDGVYKGQGPVRTIGTAVLVATFNDLIDEELGYKITRAAIENKSIQEGAFPPAKGVKFEELSLIISPIPLHAGSVRYFTELGVKVPDKLTPPEYKKR